MTKTIIIEHKNFLVGLERLERYFTCAIVTTLKCSLLQTLYPKCYVIVCMFEDKLNPRR